MYFIVSRKIVTIPMSISFLVGLKEEVWANGMVAFLCPVSYLIISFLGYSCIHILISPSYGTLHIIIRLSQLNPSKIFNFPYLDLICLKFIFVSHTNLLLLIIHKILVYGY